MLRASDVWCMDDQTEITYALQDVLGPIVAERDGSGEEKYYLRGVARPEVIKAVCSTWCTHIACLSASAEVPSQWKDYAGCTGYAIGFDQHALGKWCASRNIALLPMNYELSVQQKILREFLESERGIELTRLGAKEVGAATVREVRSHANKYLHSLTLSMKSEEWHRQQEWRILVV